MADIFTQDAAGALGVGVTVVLDKLCQRQSSAARSENSRAK